MQLAQVRDCDGACCIESPRFPNKDHSDCIFHVPVIGKESSGCMLMTGEAKVPLRGGINYNNLTPQELFQETCVNWPQNSTPRLGETDDCCLQWVEDGD